MILFINHGNKTMAKYVYRVFAIIVTCTSFTDLPQMIRHLDW